MIKCPICNKNINELDEVCPYCKTDFDKLDGIDQKIKLENKEENKERIQKMDFVLNERVPNRTNADNLNVMANINIVLSIIGAILIWANFGTQEIRHKGSYWETGYTETVANWYGILGGVAVLIAGFTVFFLLKTIIDIYFEVEK